MQKAAKTSGYKTVELQTDVTELKIVKFQLLRNVKKIATVFRLLDYANRLLIIRMRYPKNQKLTQFGKKVHLQTCEMYGCPVSVWAPTCILTGVPKGISYEDCLNQDSECTGFRKRDCKLAGTPNQILEEHIENCQVHKIISRSKFPVTYLKPTFLIEHM